MARSFIRRASTSLVAVALALALVLAAAVAAPAVARPLTIAFIPQENPEKLIGDVKVITAYLAAETGLEVTGRVAQDHAAAVEALASGSADVSFMGALPFVLAQARIGAEIVLSEVYRGKPFYASAIFVRRGSGITGLGALRGKAIAFADPISESGYLYPLEIFARRKLVNRDGDPRRFFGRVYFAGGYQQAIHAVANGLVDAAGVSIYAPLLLPPDKRSLVVPIAASGPVPSHAVVVRKGLAPERRKAFVQAMLKLNKPENRHLLVHVYGPDGYVRPDHAAYARVAELARAYGIMRLPAK